MTNHPMSKIDLPLSEKARRLLAAHDREVTQQITAD